MRDYSEEFQTPCYVVESDGFRDSVAYVDGWCYGKSERIGTAVEWAEVRAMLHRDIRAHWTERNGIPVYTVSDHGNINRVRAIRLRTR
jgi:hypothetical protein